MRKLLNNVISIPLLIVSVPLLAQDTCFKVTSVQPQAGQHPITLLIATTGDYDTAAQRLFGDPTHWKVTYKAENDKTYQAATVKSVLFNAKSRTFSISLTSNVIGDGRDRDWTATIDGVEPNCNAGSTSVSLSYPPSGGNLPQDNTFLRPVQPTETATLSLTGSFAAGGGIKPLYAIKEVGNIGAPERYRFYSWLPVFTSEVDINQSITAGNEPAGYRTRIDPDSISVGGALWKVTPFKHGPFYDLTTHVQLFDFEFARTDPTSAYVGGFGTQAVTKPWQNKSGSVALTGDLYFGIEAGHNLNKPNMLDGVSVDLSHYNGIFRGVLGSDATFAVESSDWTTVVFSLTGTYRARIPTMDEPFVTEIHGNKDVGLSTKARNWVDITVTYNPFHWKYFSFQAEYKYGELPPVFSLVDHSVTVGINLSAIQPSLVKF